ncbi:MAG: RidA family protein [Acidobacteriota bacterium]|nr:RidA family protein [Acidobacteriota bacterium]
MNRDADDLQPVNPETWHRPSGYSNGMLAPAAGQILFVAGQVGWDEDERLVGAGLVNQFEQALENVVAVVKEAGGRPSHIGRFTVFVVDRHEYVAARSEIGEAYRRVMGRHFPAMALLEVQALLEPGARVEIEATAVIPAKREKRKS